MPSPDRTSGADRLAPIIIIRRRPKRGHDAHKGGVWKIAFADFMTAMMAFFLVLWIVNSTSKEARVTIARYFNPIKFVDSTPMRRGVRTIDDWEFDASDAIAKVRSAAGASGAASSSRETSPSETRIVVDRGDVLSRAIVGSWTSTNASGSMATIAKSDKSERFDLDSGERQEIIGIFGRSVRGDKVVAGKGHIDGSNDDDVILDLGSVGIRSHSSTAPFSEAEKPNASISSAQEFRREIDRSVRLLKDMAGAPEVAILEDDEGVLIKITDGKAFGMFEVGASAISRRMNTVLAAIAASLQKEPGEIIVRGFTDGRAYRRDGFDNWKLAMERAHATMKALIRDSVPESRFQRIESYADRMPIGRGLEAAENRRIEIVLKVRKRLP